MRKMNLLTELEVKNAKPAKGKFVARLLDGANLYLQVTKSESEGYNRNWIFRYELDGQRHDLGLGPAHTVGLKEARAKAAELRMQIYDGIDPAQERKDRKDERLAKKAAELKATTFAQCWKAYFQIHVQDWKHPKHAKQWESTMRDYVVPVIGSLNVADIETAHVEKILAPIWKEKPVTANRIQNRIKLVMAYAIAGGFRGKDKHNPAARDLLKARLGKNRGKTDHHAAVPVAEAPAFMAELRKRELTSARALEFAILTATRTKETLGATWDELDLKNKLWVIPAERMKTPREHRVPLSDRAVQILNALPRHGANVFLNGDRKRFGEGALLKLLQGMRPGATVHGFRSTFRDWVSERTSYPGELGELCLAHAVGDATEQAYRRGDGLKKRIRLMQTWADFLAKPLPKAAEVHDLKTERARRA